MTYEEKLQKVVSKLKDERDLTRKGHETKAIINDASFTKVRIGDACKILLKLKDDEKILTILRAYRLEGDIASHEDPRSINCDNINEVEVALGEAFDGWYESYLMRQKTDLKHIDYINLLRIYDVVLDINEQVQLTSKTTVYINLLPPLIRFQILFPNDTPGLRNQYCDNRIRSIKYLKEKGAIVSFDNNKSGWDTRANVSLVLSKFDHFFETIKNEYINRNQTENKKEMSVNKSPEIYTTAPKKTKWPDNFTWKDRKYVFGDLGSIDFNSSDRRHIFKTLADKKGEWATINELKGNKDAGYVRTTIKQIEDRLPSGVEKVLKIISTRDEDTEETPRTGAYKIKLLQS